MCVYRVSLSHTHTHLCVYREMCVYTAYTVFMCIQALSLSHICVYVYTGSLSHTHMCVCVYRLSIAVYIGHWKLLYNVAQ